MIYLNGYTDSLKSPIEHYICENKKIQFKKAIISEMITYIDLKRHQRGILISILLSVSIRRQIP